MAKPSHEASASTTLPVVDTNSAYYIHASDYPRQMHVITPLSNNNYGDWSKEMRNFLFAKNKFGFVNGTIKKPTDPSTKKLWQLCDAMVKCWLKTAMENEILCSVEHALTAEEIWRNLEERFGKGSAPRANDLKRKLTPISQDRDSVSAYYTRLQGLWNESNSISPLPKCACVQCTCGIGKKLMEVKEREKMYEFLMGLHDTYGVVKTQILTMNPTPTLEAAYHMVLEDERQRLVLTGKRQVSALPEQSRQAIIAGETAAALGTKPHNQGAKESEKEKLMRSIHEQIWRRLSGSSAINKSTLTQIPTATAALSALQKPYFVSEAQTAKLINSKSVPKPSGNQESMLIEMINSLIVDRSPSVKWEDIAGLENAKQALLEMVILPTKRKDLFTGLRRPAKGLLLFGPPGTGKTMLAKAVASESQATFFSVSASSLTSKWVGEGEKLVRTLFTVASSQQPSVIFIDEIDSIMSARTTNEHDASRRLKSEFLVQFDGVTYNSNDLVIVIGATNKPQDLDDAVLRRLVKKIYIPLPDANGRRLLLKNNLKGQEFSLPGGDLERLVADTEGYSGSDLQALCEEAAMMPIREFGPNILTVEENQVRGLRYGDFKKAMSVIRPSLQKSKWKEVEEWNEEFGAN